MGARFFLLLWFLLLLPPAGVLPPNIWPWGPDPDVHSQARLTRPLYL